MDRKRPRNSRDDAPDLRGTPDGADVLAALDALRALDEDRAQVARAYGKARTPTIVLMAIVYGLLNLTYWMVPQAFLGRFDLPWNPAWLLLALLAASVLLIYAMVLLYTRAHGIRPRLVIPAAPVRRSGRFWLALGAHVAMGFVLPVAALFVGYATSAWWSAVAVTLAGALLNAAAEAWEFDETVRALERPTDPAAPIESSGASPGMETEARHGV